MIRESTVLLILLIVSSQLAAQDDNPRPLDPEIKIELFAEQPQIVTPTGLDVDHKGRVWAIESNTHFPPEGYSGHPTDRILVMQDTNSDGKADKIVTFTDGLTYTMSVAVKPVWLGITQSGKPKAESGKLQKSAFRSPLSAFVATRRDIFLFHDDDGDLKADRKERIIRLETKGNYPHNGLAGFAFDAMGWMYFGFGENLGADYKIIGSDGTTLSGGGEGGNIYRCRPDGTKLKQWATGFWNPHASCVDAFGRLFTVDNDPDSRPPCRLLHIIEGGDYGYRFSNGRKGLHPFTAWNGEIPGTLPMISGTGEAPSGIVAYESDGLPKKYIGNLLVTSWGDHRIDRFVLEPKGASFQSRPETIIQGGENFHPVGLAVAPDSSLYCTDWVLKDYKLHGHGRIWRISAKNEPKRKVIDAATITPKTPIEELKKMLASSRLDVRRSAANAMKRNEQGRNFMFFSLGHPEVNSRSRIEALWALMKVKRGTKWKYQDINVLAETLIATDDDVIADEVTTAALWLYEEMASRTAQLELKTGGYALGYVLPFIHRSDPTYDLALLSPWRFFDEDQLSVSFLGSLDLEVASQDPFLQTVIVQSFSNVKSQKLISKWLNFAQKQKPRTRLMILLASRRKDPRSSDFVLQFLNDPSPDVRRVAVQWVAEENLTDLRPQVEAILNGKNMTTDLFLATLAALEMLDGKSPKDFDKTPPAKYVLPLVKDDKRSPAVRAQALRLVDIDDKAISEKLFRELLKSKDYELRLEAIRTLQFTTQPFARILLAEVATLPSPWKEPKTADEYKKIQSAHNSHRQLVLEAVLGMAHVLERDSTNRIALETLKKLLPESLEIRIEVIRSLRGVAGRNHKVEIAINKSVAHRTGNPDLWDSADQHLYLALHQVLAKDDHWRTNWLKKRPKSNADWLKLGLINKTKYDDFMNKFGMDSAAAGRRVFFHPNGPACYKCHTVNGRGGNLGPDLSSIGRGLSRKRLAESIIEPSKEIAPQFTNWTFVMESGKVHHGMILGDTRDDIQRIGTAEGTVVSLNAKKNRTPAAAEDIRHAGEAG